MVKRHEQLLKLPKIKSTQTKHQWRPKISKKCVLYKFIDT